MNNNYISNSSVGPTVSKSSRYYGLPYSKQAPGSPQSIQDQARPHKIQVLKPIINYKHNAHKVIGIDMSQEEYFFYKPILGGRRLSNKAVSGEQGNSPGQSPIGKKENQQPHQSLHHNSSNMNMNMQTVSNSKENQQSKIHHSHMSHLNSNHLMSPKAVITNSLLQNQKNIVSYSPGAQIGLNDGSNSTHKVNYIQNYTSNSQPLTQRFLHDENHNSNKPYQQQQNGSKGTEKENSSMANYSSQLTSRGGQTFDHQQSPNTSRYTSNMNSRPSLSKKDLTGTTATIMHEDSTSLQLQKNQVLNYENNKQLNNNPLKDISNRVVNQVHPLGPKSSTPSFEASAHAAKNRYSMPFEIAPTNSTSGNKNLKINNYLDQPFKQITPSLKTDHQRSHIQDSQSPFSQADHHHQSRYDKGVKITNFEDQTNKYPSGKSKVSNNGYFEKKRLSDNTLKSNNGPNALDEKYQEEVIREIFDKKEKQRKGHNISVTTNTSTTSNNTARKSNVNTYGQYGNQSTVNLNATGRKSHTNSKTSSLNQTPQHNNASQPTQSTSLNSLQSQLQHQEKMLHQVMESIRRKTKPTFSLNETSRIIQDINRQVKSLLNDSSLEFLLRQHTRTQYISLAFVRGLEDDLSGGAKSNENLQAIMMNALDYIKKNIKSFTEIIENSVNNGNKNHKGSKKDLNSNPFGVIGPGGSRNGANKENYGGNSNTTTCKNIGSKSEKKMFIKQNIQIALAFLKKICRLTKINQDKFKDFLQILNQIESGTQSSKVKEQVKRALHQIRNDSKQLMNTQSTISFSQTQKNFLNQSQRKHQRRESMTIEIEDDVMSHPIPFGFAELKEAENEESTEENLQTLDCSSRKVEIVTLDNLDDGKNESKKLLENPYPNLLEQQPGRLSLQPQPLAGLKLGPGTPKMERIEALQSDTYSPDQKENQQPPSQGSGGQTVTNSPQLSIVTKKHANRISNTHEPITVRGARPSHRIRFDEEDKLQYCVAPAHINARSNSLPSREPYLPADIAKGYDYTLVLDLDETLVHFDPKIRTYRPRPGALKFLNEMSKYYELVVFTAGLKDYADWILNDFDRQGYITHRLYRDHTKYRNGVYVKDLSKLGRDMSKIIIIDNIEENFQAQPDNGIPIKGWYHDQNDRELDKYAPFLKKLVVNRITDVRPEVKLFKVQQSSVHSFIQHHTITINNNGTTTATTTSQYTNGGITNRSNNNYNHQYGGGAANKHLQPWGSDSESERDKTSEEEEEEESSEEEKTPPKKKPAAQKKKQDSDDEDESDKQEESDEDEEDSSQKKKPSKAAAKKKDSSSEEEESEPEESDDEPKQKASNKQANVQQDTKAIQEAMKKIKDLEEQMESMKEDMEKKDEEIQQKEEDIGKISQKMMKMDEEKSQLREELNSKEAIIETKQGQIEDLEAKLKDKNSVIAVQQAEISELSKSNIVIDGLNKQLSHKQEEIGVLKAKLYLDMIALNFKVVAEYPDMVDENNSLQQTVASKDREIDSLQGKVQELQSHIKDQDEELQNKEKRIKELNKEKEGLNKTIKELQANKKQLLEIQKVHENQIQQLEHEIQSKNDELEQRLENISKLIQKNEQLNQQVRIQKQRMEKFKNDQVNTYQKDLQDKSSEIEVLKEMVKGNQLQLRAKEKELVRYKQRALQLEGAQLAQRQQQNMVMNNHGQMIPNNAQMNPNAKRTLGQIKNTPQRYTKQIPQSQSSKLQSVNTSKSYFPPLDNRSQGGDQYSQYSGKSMNTNNRAGGSKERQTRITPISNNGLDSHGNVRSSLSKRIVEEAENEMEHSNSVDKRVFQQQLMQSQKSNGIRLPPQLQQLQIDGYQESNVYNLANEVREVVQQENDELDADDHHQNSTTSAALRASQKSATPFSLNQDITPISQNQQRQSLVENEDEYQQQEDEREEEQHDEEEYE